MRKSLCCKAPAAIHGARRRRCAACGHTWSVRMRKRGRKPKRGKKELAEKILREKVSSRGLAISRHIPRETLRRRIGNSLEVWKRTHPCPTPPAGPLIAILDAMWFVFRKGIRYTSYLILLRPAAGDTAVLAQLALRRGRESKAGWSAALDEFSPEVLSRIVAIVMDGNTGLMRIAKERSWYFQWCHAHMKRRVWELRGVRKLPAQRLRQRITKIVYRFLETDSDQEAARCLFALRKMFDQPDCPRSFPSRLSGILKRSRFFRTYREAPELNMPATTNSAEQIHSRIRERWSAWRGICTPHALAYWLDIFQREIQQVHCRGFKETIQHRPNHGKNGS